MCAQPRRGDDPATAVVSLPTEALERRLSAALAGGADRAVTVSGREPGVEPSYNPTEIVTCRIGTDAPMRVFCKHLSPSRPRRVRPTRTAAGPSAPPERHRPDSFYEIDVYRHVLGPLPVSLPRCLGAWTDESSGDGLLVLEDLGHCERVSRAKDPVATMAAAARWLRRFHAHSASLLSGPELQFLLHLDRRFYGERLAALLRIPDLEGEMTWLRLLADRFDDVLQVFVESTTTVVHGEFYPANVLVAAGRIYPVDWETASVGIGELDLMTLMEGWNPRVVESCIAAYEEEPMEGARPPHDLRWRLAAAQVLVDIYWISHGYTAVRRLRRLRETACSLGLV